MKISLSDSFQKTRCIHYDFIHAISKVRRFSCVLDNPRMLNNLAERKSGGRISNEQLKKQSLGIITKMRGENQVDFGNASIRLLVSINNTRVKGMFRFQRNEEVELRFRNKWRISGKKLVHQNPQAPNINVVIVPEKTKDQLRTKNKQTKKANCV